jgi:hypothetical protein
MQDGSRQQGQGITFATNSFTKQDCIFLAKILNDKYALKTPPRGSAPGGPPARGAGGVLLKLGLKINEKLV